MLKTIVWKELLEHLRSYRFVVITAVSLLLVFTSITVMYKNYQSRVETYEEMLPDLGPNSILLKPADMSILVRGMDEALCSQSGMNAYFVGGGQASSNALFNLFATPDMLYVVKIILALCAILLSFNLVSGEKEGHTLALSLSNSVNRTNLLLGKWIGGLTVLTLPLLIAILGVGIFFSASTAFQADIQLWTRLGLLMLSSALYLSFFFTLGILVSCFYARSSSALVVSLFLWVTFVFIIPGLGGSAASALVEIPSAQSRGIRQQLVFIKQAAKRMQEDETAPPSPDDYVDLKKQIEDYRTRLGRQISLAKLLTSVSPTAVYVQLATDFAGTGILERLNFKRMLIEQQAMLAGNSDGQSAGTINVTYNRLTPSEILAGTGISNLLIILLQNVVVFSAAYVLFLRYDVR